VIDWSSSLTLHSVIYQSLTTKEVQPLLALLTTLEALQDTFHALLALFFVEDPNISIPGSIQGGPKYQLLVRVDPKTGKRVGQRLTLRSLIMSDARMELAKVTTTWYKYYAGYALVYFIADSMFVYCIDGIKVNNFEHNHASISLSLSLLISLKIIMFCCCCAFLALCFNCTNGPLSPSSGHYTC
jgi:hypothetical protein